MGSWREKWVDYYEILGASLDEDIDSIKRKYRDLVKKYHPDVYNGDDANDKISSFSDAIAVLGDEEERKLYDEVYIARLNGEYSDMEEEKPKYTEEEMNAKFSEAEIRQAKREAFKANVEEELEKAKIIIDAKNELLYAGYTDELTGDMYNEALEEFVNCSNEYIVSLDNFLKMALEMDLMDTANLIREIISYLDEVIASVPTNATDAKIEVEKEFIKEQLMSDFEEEKKKFKSLEVTVLDYFKDIMNREISILRYPSEKGKLLLQIEDMILIMQKYTEIFLKYEMDTEDIHSIFGKLEGFKYIVDQEYEDTLDIAERLSVKNKIDRAIDFGIDNQEKVVRIYKIISRHPTNKKRQYLVKYAYDLLNSSSKQLKLAKNLIDSHKDEDDILIDSINLTKEAKAIFSEASEINKIANRLYKDQTKVTFDGDEIVAILKAGLSVEDKMKALEMLEKVKVMMKKMDYIDSLNVSSWESKKAQIDVINMRNLIAKNVFMELDEALSLIIDNFNKYDRDNPQGSAYVKELAKRAQEMLDNKESASTSEALNLVVAIVSFACSMGFDFKTNPILSSLSGLIFLISGINLCRSVIRTKKKDKLYEDLVEEMTIREQYYSLLDGSFEFPDIEAILDSKAKLVK